MNEHRADGQRCPYITGFNSHPAIPRDCFLTTCNPLFFLHFRLAIALKFP